MTPVRLDDTIVATATAPGRAALAIVRLAGPQTTAIGKRLIDPWPQEARRATLARVVDTDGVQLDEAIVVHYEAPASFTGDDVVEVTCHGGPIIAATIVAAFVSAGARPAEPGEFTRRAVMNGKLDLIQAEAVGDLVDARSRAAQGAALAQLDGGLSRRIAQLRDDILGLEAMTAYDIDFPEEDDGPLPASRIVAAAEAVVARIDDLLSTAPVGELVREGATVVIAGAPNVGKSSLFNALLRRRRAIVSDVPGTTRDALEAVTEAQGWPIRLVDTAGLRDASELVERLGIEVSQEYLQRADVVLVCGETEDDIARARRVVAKLTSAPVVEALTKSDLRTPADRANGSGALRASAHTGEGITAIGDAIAAALQSVKGPLALDAPLVTRERHRAALQRARDELRAFLDAFTTGRVPAVVSAVHLREATRHLEELVGVIDIEDVLARVFASFCVGK